MVTRARTPEPTNTSRAAGAPAPASAAATEPRTVQPDRGFYAPEGESPLREEPQTSGLATAGEAFTAGVRRDHMAGGEHFGSADREVLEHAAAEAEAGAEDLDATIARIRATRKPLGAYSQKLALDKRPGYHRHWFNDSAGRIDEAKASGWAHVKGTDGKPISRCVGSGRDKGALYAFAMEIPEVFWLEDQAVKHAMATDKIDALKRTPAMASAGNRATASDKGKFYDPSESETPVQIHKG